MTDTPKTTARKREPFQARGRFIYAGQSEHDAMLGEVYDNGQPYPEEMAQVWAASHCTMFPALAKIRNDAWRVANSGTDMAPDLRGLLRNIGALANDALPVPTIGDMAVASPAAPEARAPAGVSAGWRPGAEAPAKHGTPILLKVRLIGDGPDGWSIGEGHVTEGGRLWVPGIAFQRDDPAVLGVIDLSIPAPAPAGVTEITPGMCVAASDAALATGIMLPASHAEPIISAALSAARAVQPQPSADVREAGAPPTIPEMLEMIEVLCMRPNVAESNPATAYDILAGLPALKDATLRAGQPAGQWQDIASAPDAGTVLVWYPPTNGYAAWTAIADLSSENVHPRHSGTFHPRTKCQGMLWQPLPTPPAPSAEGVNVSPASGEG